MPDSFGQEGSMFSGRLFTLVIIGALLVLAGKVVWQAAAILSFGASR